MIHKTTKNHLTFEEFCTLVGLAHLAEETDKQMIAIVRAVANVSGEVLDEHDYGHAADMVYSPLGGNPTESVKLMLRNLEIVYDKEARDEETEADADVSDAQDVPG